MWKIGNVQVTPIFETEGSDVITAAIPEATQENLAGEDWLKPYVDSSGKLLASSQGFLIETNSTTILVDTGVGNNKKYDEAIFPGWSGLQTDFLKNISKPVDAIDIVVCTHFHNDHVGWNTQRSGDKWIPTFPNARYTLVAKELDYWLSKPPDELEDDLRSIDEAIVPLIDAGVVDRVESDHRLTNEVSLLPTPGHTPGHVSVFIESEGETAVITGDLFHHPCQIAYPDWMSFALLPDDVLRSRTAFLERFGDTDTLVIGTHFTTPAGGYIKRSGTGFVFSPLEG